MNGEVSVWDLSTDRLLFRQKLHRGNVMDVKFTPDGRFFASGGLDGVIHLRRIEKPEDLVHDFTMRTLGHLAFTPDGRRLVAGGQFSTMISVWETNDGRLVREIGPTAGKHLKSMAVTPDSRHILTAGHREEAEDPEKRQEAERAEAALENRLPGLGPAQPKQPTVKRTEIRLWDIETGERIRDLNRPEEIGFGDVALSPDGRRMAIVNFGGLRLLDPATGESQWTVDLPGWWGRPVAFSSDGRHVALPEQNAVAIFIASSVSRP
jgi:WD40 repeat protein